MSKTRNIKTIDLTDASQDQQALLSLLFAHVHKNRSKGNIFHQGEEYDVDGFDEPIRFEQTAIFYESVKHPEECRAVVVDAMGKIIGEGGYGQVYPVMGTLYKNVKGVYDFKLKNKKPRVVKKTRVDDSHELTGVAAIENEASLMQEKHHFHGKDAIFEDDKQTAYLISRRFEGEELFDFLEREYKTLDEISRLKIVINLFKSLQAQIHDQGIIHRDLKLENILINPDTLDVSIIDVGLSTKQADASTAGTQNYMAPEAFMLSIYNLQDPGMHFVDQKSDIYSMGIIASLVFDFYSNLREVRLDGLNGERLIDQLEKEIQISPVTFKRIPKNIAKILQKILKQPKADRLAIDDIIDRFEAVLVKREVKLSKREVKYAKKAKKVTKAIRSVVDSAMEESVSVGMIASPMPPKKLRNAAHMTSWIKALNESADHGERVAEFSKDKMDLYRAAIFKAIAAYLDHFLKSREGMFYKQLNKNTAKDLKKIISFVEVGDDYDVAKRLVAKVLTDSKKATKCDYKKAIQDIDISDLPVADRPK